MKLAAKFGAPVITLIDTPGAYPGLGAEERGQSEALARNILEMAALPTPIVAVVIGEGGSGGALALGVADRSPDAGELGLLGDLAGGLRRDSLEGRDHSGSAPPRRSSSPPRTCCGSS